MDKTFNIFKGIFEIVEQVIRYNLLWVSLRLIKREAVDSNTMFSLKYDHSNLILTFNTIF